MRYIAQYIKKLCPCVSIKESKTTDSKYYHMEHGFEVRLSEHMGHYKDKRLSIVKPINSDNFIVIVEKNPYPLLLTRNEVKNQIKVLYDYFKLKELSSAYYTAKAKHDFETTMDFGDYWSIVISKKPLLQAIVSKSLKKLYREAFEKGLKGYDLYNVITKTKLDTRESSAKEWIEKAFEKKETKTG